MSDRKFALYFSWSRTKEIEAPLGVLENRFPALFEFRRAIWPHYEKVKDPERFKQDVSGFLDEVILSDFNDFIKFVEDVTRVAPAVIQREGADGEHRLSDGLLGSVNTLIVVSLDHFRTSQEASSAELGAVKRFLSRKGSCLIVCPHHDVGATNDVDEQIAEQRHHGDPLVPAQQRIGGFARSLLAGLRLPIENKFGLNPATSEGKPAPLILQDADTLDVLKGVTTFNAHPHLPHLHVPAEIGSRIRILAKQRINGGAPQNPFVGEENQFFNALLWAPAEGERLGNVFVCDATLWSSAFGGIGSLTNFWLNLTKLPLPA